MQFDEPAVDDRARVQHDRPFFGGHEFGGSKPREHRGEVSPLVQSCRHAEVDADQHQQHRCGGRKPLGPDEPQGLGCEQRDEQSDDEADRPEQNVGWSGLSNRVFRATPHGGQLTADNAAENVTDRAPKNDKNEDDVVPGKTEFVLPVDKSRGRIASQETPGHERESGDCLEHGPGVRGV